MPGQGWNDKDDTFYSFISVVSSIKGPINNPEVTTEHPGHPHTQQEVNLPSSKYTWLLPLVKGQ